MTELRKTTKYYLLLGFNYLENKNIIFVEISLFLIFDLKYFLFFLGVCKIFIDSSFFN